MYKIIGADNVEYGPVSGAQIRQWINEGRANSHTRIRAEGSADWKPLSEYPEFADVTASSVPSPPPILAAAPAPASISRLAIASLIFAILGCVTFGVTALFGLVLGIIALVQTSRSRGALRGNGIALAGSILSGLLLLFLPILAALLLPAMAQAKSKAQSVMCMNNMKQLALGGIMYAGDNKDRFPSADSWCDAVGKYVPSPRTFQCPAGNPAEKCHYAFNAKLSGMEVRTVNSPAQTVLMFETDGGWNLSGGPELVLKRRRHGNLIGFVFADGHCELRRDSRLGTLRWDP